MEVEPIVFNPFELRAWQVQSAVVCRTCLQTGNLKDIRSLERGTEYLCSAISSEPIIESQLPCHLCDRCIKMLEITLTFRKIGQRSTELLGTYIQNGGAWPVTEMLADPEEPAALEQPESPVQRHPRRRKPLDRALLDVIRRRLFADELDSTMSDKLDSSGSDAVANSSDEDTLSQVEVSDEEEDSEVEELSAEEEEMSENDNESEEVSEEEEENCDEEAEQEEEQDWPSPIAANQDAGSVTILDGQFVMATGDDQMPDYYEDITTMSGDVTAAQTIVLQSEDLYVDPKDYSKLQREMMFVTVDGMLYLVEA